MQPENSEEDTPAPPQPIPDTKTPTQVFNQQNNFNSIPPTAWDRLNPDQTVDLTKHLVDRLHDIDGKRFSIESQRITADGNKTILSLLAGLMISISGLGAIVYLAVNNQKEVASILTTSLVTLVAVIVGAKFFNK